MQQLKLWDNYCFKVPECREAPLTMTSQKAAMLYICLRGVYYLYLGMHRSWACHDPSYICHSSKLIFIVGIIQSSSLVGSLFIETHYCFNELHIRAVSDYIIIGRVSHSMKTLLQTTGTWQKKYPCLCSGISMPALSHSWLLKRLKIFLHLCFLLITPMFWATKQELEHTADRAAPLPTPPVAALEIFSPVFGWSTYNLCQQWWK